MVFQEKDGQKGFKRDYIHFFRASGRQIQDTRDDARLSAVSNKPWSCASPTLLGGLVGNDESKLGGRI